MLQPTGKLKFAYKTISIMESEIEKHVKSMEVEVIGREKLLRENFKLNRQAQEKKEKVKKLEDVIKYSKEFIQDLPELNPSNYNHDDVCTLNSGVCEMFSYLDKELTQTPNTDKVEV